MLNVSNYISAFGHQAQPPRWYPRLSVPMLLMHKRIGLHVQVHTRTQPVCYLLYRKCDESWPTASSFCVGRCSPLSSSSIRATAVPLENCLPSSGSLSRLLFVFFRVPEIFRFSCLWSTQNDATHNFYAKRRFISPHKWVSAVNCICDDELAANSRVFFFRARGLRAL